MSRIEEALEKAISLRKSYGDGAVLGAPAGVRPVVSPVRTYVPPPEEKVRVENPYLVTVTQPHSPVAEEYRKLKSLVVSLSKNGGFRNTLLVTSSLGGEGKSLTALNLAVTLAHEFDHTVLLVDADLRKPALHTYLGIEPQQGLADCLASGLDVGHALVKTGIGKLSFLPAGSDARNPAEMLASQKMRDLVHELKSRYPDRYVIFDSPPVLPVAETRSLCGIVDGVLFVVRERIASAKEIQESLASLNRAEILGVVYNGTESTAGHGRYDYYHSGYGHKSA